MFHVTSAITWLGGFVALFQATSSTLMDIDWSKSSQIIPTPTTAGSAAIYDNTLFIIDDQMSNPPQIHHISLSNLYNPTSSPSNWSSTNWSLTQYQSIGYPHIRTDCHSCYASKNRYLYIVAPGPLYGIMLKYDMRLKEPVSIDDYNWNTTMNGLAIKWPCM